MGKLGNLQEVLDDLIWDDIAHIVCIGQLRKGNSSHFSLLQVSKSRPSTVACIILSLLSIFHWSDAYKKTLMI